eukprot:108665_1
MSCKLKTSSQTQTDITFEIKLQSQFTLVTSSQTKTDITFEMKLKPQSNESISISQNTNQTVPLQTTTANKPKTKTNTPHHQDVIKLLRTRESLRTELEEKEKEFERLKAKNNDESLSTNSNRNLSESLLKHFKLVYKQVNVMGRYVVLDELHHGVGVHKGWDTQNCDWVCIKMHMVNPQWSDDRKVNFTKHAIREYEIQKSLKHMNVIALYDVFAMDIDTMATVMEMNYGTDMGRYLKVHKRLSEQEAACVMAQVFIALKYLHTRNPIIIHYDLKPGNLLYHKGHIKITDFGLSKRMEQEDDSIELTSKGAGTYWYLPPECFECDPHDEPVMITPAVDIWSAGVIFFQLLYGTRPFGNDLSQESILRRQTILSAHCVIFPNQPNVSKEAKDLIFNCCAYNPKRRLSAQTIVDKHPYFSYLRK